MLYTILATATAFLLVIFAIPSIITVAKLIGLYDKPNDRKLHTKKIPRLGGLAIFASFALASLIWGKYETINGLQYLMAALIILFFSGLKDDIIILSPYKKLLSQIVASGLVAMFTSIRISHFHGILGVYEIPLFIGIPLTMFTLIVITNAFNLVDGVDGLAGSLGLVISLTYAIWFAFIGEPGWSIMAFALSGAILGFLFFNFNPAKIFMGDAGSYTVGFLLAVFTIHFLEMNNPLLGNADYKLGAAPGIAMAIMVIPLYDTLRVFVLRVSKKQSPFKADKNHIHHWLLKTGLNHKEVSLSLAAINVIFIVLAFAIKDNSAVVVVSIIVGLATAAGQLPAYFLRHKITDIEADASSLVEIEDALNISEKVLK